MVVRDKIKKIRNINNYQHGFTIVELIVVVSVVGILASIVTISGQGYIDRAAEQNIKTSLLDAHREMKKIYNEEGAYPSEVPSSVSVGSGVALTPDESLEDNHFCITGTARDMSFYITDAANAPAEGTCSSYNPSDPGGGGPDPDPGGELALSMANTEINLQAGNGMYPFTSNVTTNGGTPPYTYTLAANDLNTLVLPDVPNAHYSVSHDNSTGGEPFAVLMPNAIYELSEEPESVDPSFENQLIIADNVSDDFATVCNDWAMNDITAHLKLIVTDSDSNTANQNFTLRCIIN